MDSTRPACNYLLPLGQSNPFVWQTASQLTDSTDRVRSAMITSSGLMKWVWRVKTLLSFKVFSLSGDILWSTGVTAAVQRRHSETSVRWTVDSNASCVTSFGLVIQSGHTDRLFLSQYSSAETSGFLLLYEDWSEVSVSEMDSPVQNSLGSFWCKVTSLQFAQTEGVEVKLS